MISPDASADDQLNEEYRLARDLAAEVATAMAAMPEFAAMFPEAVELTYQKRNVSGLRQLRRELETMVQVARESPNVAPGLGVRSPLSTEEVEWVTRALRADAIDSEEQCDGIRRMLDCRCPADLIKLSANTERDWVRLERLVDSASVTGFGTP